MPSKKTASPYVRLGATGKPVAPKRTKHHAMVKDVNTGLIWSATSHKVANWAEAEELCKTYSLGDHKDWRMPTVKELIGIVDYGRRAPAIDPKAFPGTPEAWHWSSSPVVGWPEYAWYVDFGYGSVYDLRRSYSGFVRPVRDLKR